MIFAVSTYGVTFCEDAAHRCRILMSHFTDEKERRLHALSGLKKINSRRRALAQQEQAAGRVIWGWQPFRIAANICQTCF